MASYQAVKLLHEEKGYSIKSMCEFLQVACSAYYRWLKQPESVREQTNRHVAEVIRTIHDKHPDMGYRRIKDELKRNHQMTVNDKRVLRICRHEQIQSTIKHPANCITRRAYSPYHKAKNILQGQFKAKTPNQKWVTDVSEFKYFIGQDVHRVYLSAILDLYDRRIVTYVLSDTNDLDLVFDTFDQAVALEPEAHPIFHSDQGFQYTHVKFFNRIKKAEMIQSMSRAGKCTDNGPMEGFWGILKRENYYGRKFTSREELVTMISDYMTYYNTGRYQRKLAVMTPMEYHDHYYEAA